MLNNLAMTKCRGIVLLPATRSTTIQITMASKIAPQMAFRAFRAAPRAAPWASLSAQLPRAQPAFRRFFASPAQEQPRLRLGSTGMDWI